MNVKMKEAAATGRDSTKDIIARVVRAIRLGERSRSFVDSSAASCCLILTSIVDSIEVLLQVSLYEVNAV